MKIHRITIFAYILLIFVLCIDPVSGADIYVGEGLGNNTINAALANATDGDVIIVSDGVYTENISIQKQITIRSENGSGSTIIQPESGASVFNITASNVTIDGFNITGGSGPVTGVLLFSASDCIIMNNEISQCIVGIGIIDSNNITLINNSVGSSFGSILFLNSINCTLNNNTMISDEYNFGVWTTDPDDLEYYLHNIDSSNQVNGKKLYYLVNEADIEVPSDAGQVYAVNSNNITIKDLAVSYAVDGIAFVNTSNSKIESVDVSHCDNGILLLKSGFNTVTGITANDNYYGIHNHNSDNNRLISSTINNSEGTGVLLCYSNNITIISNTICGNGYDGIGVHDSTDIVLTDNIANSNSEAGIYLEDSHNNTLSGNTANENYIGLWLEESEDNALNNNIANENTRSGLYLYDSNNNILSSNTANRNARVGIRISESHDNLLVRNTADDSNDDYMIAAIRNTDREPIDNFWFAAYGIERNSGHDALQDSVLPDNSVPIMDVAPFSYGIEISYCYNTTLSENHATGSSYALRVRDTENITVNNLVVTSDRAAISFDGYIGEIILGENSSTSVPLSGKTNVNGYVDILSSAYRVRSMTMDTPMFIDIPTSIDIRFSYDDSGMSTAGESSIALYNLSSSEWIKLQNSTLNTRHNYVSATIDTNDVDIDGGIMTSPTSRVITLALFKDPETRRSGSSVMARERSQGTITTLPIGNDGEITGDTVVKSSDSSTALTMFKGTKALDPFGNPVNSIIITTPFSFPSDIPAEVVESGLYFRFGPSGTTFSQDIMITMEFNPADFEGRTPVIYTYTSEDGWIALETTVDWENGRATAMISHFSVYALFGTDAEPVRELALAPVSEPAKPVIADEGPTEESTDGKGFGFLPWVVAIVLVMGLGIIYGSKKKKEGGL